MKDKQSILSVAAAIKDFETSDAANSVLSAQRHYRAALRDLFESRLDASRQVKNILERVEACLADVERESALIPWDEANRPAKEESHYAMEQLIAAKVHLELCVASLQVQDFDEDFEKDTLCIMDEAREFILELFDDEDERPETAPKF